jgi:GNAT superfamily N-acetyltransferase
MDLEALYASDPNNPFLEMGLDRKGLLTKPHLAAYAGKQLVAVTGTVFEMIHEFELGRDFTHLDFRRRGIHRALVSTFIRRLREAGETRKILAWTREENDGAQKLFEALGFERIGEFCSFILKPDELRGQ